MISVVVGWLGNLPGGPFAKAALDAYRAKLAAGNTSERITADLAARELIVEKCERELATQILIGEQGHWYYALCQAHFLLSHLSYMRGKSWSGNKVLGLGATTALPGEMGQWAMIVLTAYFGGRSIEKVARILNRK
jgi:hypothetical protein